MVYGGRYGQLAAAAYQLSDQPMASAPGGVRLRSLPAQSAKLLLKDSISALPLHKVLVLKEAMEGEHDTSFAAHERLALARILPTEVGNLRFGPEVGVGSIKHDAAVVSSWLARMRSICDDLRQLQPLDETPADAKNGDARMIGQSVEPNSVDAVITSPPYPNEKDYSRTVRLESVLLGYLTSRADLQAMKRGLVRSNTRGVYRDDEDDAWVSTGHLLAEIAERAGYEVESIDLFRTRQATATRDQLREEVLVLRWPGTASSSPKR